MKQLKFNFKETRTKQLVSISLDPEVLIELDRRAALDMRNRSSYINHLLKTTFAKESK